METSATQAEILALYQIKLNGGTGGIDGNICNPSGNPCTPGGTPVAKMGFGRFEYFNNGEWFVYDAGSTGTSVFDTDTASTGALFAVTRTGADTYDVLMQPIGHGPNFAASRTFSNAGVPVDWIEFVFFNTNTDTIPTLAEPQTDLYIRSIAIIPEPATATMLVTSAGTLLGVAGGWRRRRK
jgi:hypothetical protein